jgi:hypothetical protein
VIHFRQRKDISSCTKGRTIVQAVSFWPLTAEARVRTRASPCGICGGQSGSRTGFSRSTSVFACQFHPTGAPLHVKTKTITIFITGLHNKPQGCNTFLAAAVGPFATIKNSSKKGPLDLEPSEVAIHWAIRVNRLGSEVDHIFHLVVRVRMSGIFHGVGRDFTCL